MIVSHKVHDCFLKPDHQQLHYIVTSTWAEVYQGSRAARRNGVRLCRDCLPQAPGKQCLESSTTIERLGVKPQANTEQSVRGALHHTVFLWPFKSKAFGISQIGNEIFHRILCVFLVLKNILHLKEAGWIQLQIARRQLTTECQDMFWWNVAMTWNINNRI